MKGKWELGSALLYLALGIFYAFSSPGYGLGTVIWCGNGVLQLSLFALANGCKKLSLGLFVCDVVSCLLVSLSLANWSGFAISIWCLVFPIVLLSYWHRYKKEV
ncbi:MULTISPECIES: hypothetical protein [unclassified Streptococcus]|uniref:hypothetical protein n=1 Tax=unclassified Streptococcus TaxID=2608887 RepID=UPI00359CD4AE